jgi:peptide/nickel transport system permease protein
VRRPTRLDVGAAALIALTLACILGPVVLPGNGDGDPLHAALLPPGARISILELQDGVVLSSPQIDERGGAFFVHGKQLTVVPANEVVERRHLRLWLGSDRFGRDVLVRLLTGGRLSLLIAALGVAVALVVGLGVGLAAATGGRVVDAILMRAVDALLAFPLLLLLILMTALFRPGPVMLVAVLGLSSWMGLARLVRGQVLSLKTRTFIQAARVAGTREHRIWTLHYLPNLKGPVAQDTALRMGNLVLAEATLSFLGFGLPATLPSWGAMVADGQRVMLDGWWLSLFPGLAITALVVSLALVGDGMQKVGRASA